MEWDAFLLQSPTGQPGLVGRGTTSGGLKNSILSAAKRPFATTLPPSDASDYSKSDGISFDNEFSGIGSWSSKNNHFQEVVCGRFCLGPAGDRRGGAFGSFFFLRGCLVELYGESDLGHQHARLRLLSHAFTMTLSVRFI